MRCALYLVALATAVCSAGCTHNPYPLFYQCTTEGLRPTQRPTRFLVQRCAPEALAERTQELLADGYVIIGRAEFESRYPFHKEIYRRSDSRGAEVILFCDSAGSSDMELSASPSHAFYGRSRKTHHTAVYFARPVEMNPGTEAPEIAPGPLRTAARGRFL